jgi:hypothetical protein
LERRNRVAHPLGQRQPVAMLDTPLARIRAFDEEVKIPKRPKAAWRR